MGDFGSTRSSSDFFEGDFVVGDFWEHSEHSEHSDFFEGDFVVGDFGSTRSSSEQLGFFLRGFCWGGFFFLGGGGVCFGL